MEQAMSTNRIMTCKFKRGVWQPGEQNSVAKTTKAGMPIRQLYRRSPSRHFEGMPADNRLQVLKFISLRTIKKNISCVE
jgi:hypothetical protein